MKELFKPIPKDKRKKILLLSDDIRMHSGVATMSREIVVNTAHHFNWFQLGAALKHPEVGKTFDLSQDLNERLGQKDIDVKVQPCNGYGDAVTVRKLINQERPDAIMLFTDPRYWIWLFEIEREIRSTIPIFWLNIWDEYPAPMYNKNYYDSVDVLMGISKQTRNINRLVLGEEADNKIIEYVPHGIDQNMFYPIKVDHPSYDNFDKFKKDLFKEKDIEFVVFFNSRNIARKHPGDTILAYKLFCDLIGKEKAKKCALVMKTEITSEHGTDLKAIKDSLTDPSYVNIFFNQERLTPEQMNMLYNVADVTVLMSSNEGWGLALTESMMTGTMTISNTTGGMQDQSRFEDENGEWIDFDSDFPSNHRGTYTKHGEWVLPVYPTNRALMGSPLTPYIFDDRASAEDVAERLKEAFELGKEERNKRGLKGREWAMSDEAMMTAGNMGNRVIEVLDKGFDSFTPRSEFDIVDSNDYKYNKVTHKLTDY
jgi:glycosyltransferase involved in cell wall biosynthesis